MTKSSIKKIRYSLGYLCVFLSIVVFLTAFILPFCLDEYGLLVCVLCIASAIFLFATACAFFNGSIYIEDETSVNGYNTHNANISTPIYLHSENIPQHPNDNNNILNSSQSEPNLDIVDKVVGFWAFSKIMDNATGINKQSNNSRYTDADRIERDMYLYGGYDDDCDSDDWI